MVNRSVFAFIGIGIGTVMVFLAAPFLKPFRVSRLLLTYLVPFVPLCLVWDGIVSCLRVYAPEELRILVAQLDAQDYEWDIGTTRVGPGVATYLIGIPSTTEKKSRE